MGSPSNAVVIKRGPSLLQGMTTPTWQASVKGAQGALAQRPAVIKLLHLGGNSYLRRSGPAATSDQDVGVRNMAAKNTSPHKPRHHYCSASGA
jgi:hypothetical protein